MSTARKFRVSVIVIVTAAVVGFALSGVVVADIVDPGGDENEDDDGPELTDFGPQTVNSSTTDTYTVTIDQTGPEGMIRGNLVPKTRTQTILVNDSFTGVTDAEIVSTSGILNSLIDRSASVQGGDVVVDFESRFFLILRPRITSVTVQFNATAPPDAGDYDWDVEMENNDQDASTGTARVTVVSAQTEPAQLGINAVDAPGAASQDETILVNATVENTDATDNVSGDIAYGLAEGSAPTFDGTDLLTQTLPNVTLGPGETREVSFFVDLTEEDEAINTGDDIQHGVAVAGAPGENITADLTIEDGPIEHSEDGGATTNRTTGLIQTAVDISSDADDDVVTVNPSGSPYNENVTVPVDNIRIQGDTSAGKPVVAWTGAPVSNPAPEAPFTVESTAENTTIRDLRIDPLVPNANGVDVLGGSNHEVLNNDIRGVNVGSPGVGVFVTGVTNPVNVSGNDIANKSIGVEFNGVDNGVVSDNVITDNDLDGVYLFDSNDNNITGNEVLRNGRDGVWIETGEGNVVDNNDVADNGRYGVYLGGTQAGANNNDVLNNDVVRSASAGVYLGAANGNNVTNNTLEDDNTVGIELDNSEQNDIVGNTIDNNTGYGVYLEDVSDFNTVSRNDITDNTGDGLHLDDAWDNEIINNSLVNNDGDGYFSLISRNNRIQNNEVANNGGDGILLSISSNNTASDNLVENNQNGIVVSGTGVSPVSTRIQPESVDNTNNMFTDDISQNNDGWDFIIETGGGFNGPVVSSLQTNPDNYPVTNLNIGASTNANTTLSFNADNIRLRSVGTPQPDPPDAANIGRYFEAEPVPETTGSFLNVSLSYEDSDVAGLDESALTLLRFNASEWQDIPGSLAEPGVNLVSANITQFSEFGAFVEGAEGEGCINRRNLGRGQEDQECPFDRGISRGGSREGIDRDTGRGGTGEHRDSATSRRNRGR